MSFFLRGARYYFFQLNFYYLFFCSYLARGVVERLEVVNKKWVRVKLLSGTSTDGMVIFNKNDN